MTFKAKGGMQYTRVYHAINDELKLQYVGDGHYRKTIQLQISSVEMKFGMKTLRINRALGLLS